VFKWWEIDMKYVLNSQDYGRLRSLLEAIDRIRGADLHSDAEFHAIFREGQKLLEISDKDLANVLLVGRTTVNRWVNGTNLPHPAMRKSIVTWIAGQLIRKVKLVEAAVKLERKQDQHAVAASAVVGAD
jgi:hypothetical protein